MQTSLFDDSNAPCIQHDLDGTQLDEYPSAFSPQEADTLFRVLMENTPWQEASLKIAGRVVKVPRLQCWMGDASSNYGYSGIRLDPVPWRPPVASVKAKVEDITGRQFNSVLLNLYRNGSDSVAWHADDEKELGPNAEIASVSFGCERVFELRRKASDQGRDKRQLLLRHGSLVFMRKGLQNRWEHQIPKVKDLSQPRINLTFRTILSRS